MRAKTQERLLEHVASVRSTDTRAVFGDSLTERLVWQHPHLAPASTWLCGVGGDRISQLAWRVANPDGTGYTQVATVTAKLTHIVVLIGSNDIGAGDGTTPREKKRIATMVGNVELMVSQLRSRWPTAEVHVFPIPPIPTSGQMERHPEFREAYLAALQARGLLTTQVAWPSSMDLDADFEDGVHLSPSGYAHLLDMLACTFS
ncbi:hypothetical protein ACHHYP_17104 [Achlya hypogyna]|uniref:SGNH hydrolase-type esterase domain-containing protein n=1 Tax=Achlya hypogyna TaxID=1202772 RepID=A0A1V9Y5B4_ACHHY|nr:hypothetical protein ACHHYP_17104 [Achlya hypogyna]